MNMLCRLLVICLSAVCTLSKYFDCSDQNVFPRTKDRICTVKPNGEIILKNGCDDSEFCENCGLECLAFTGMNLKLLCKPPTMLMNHNIEIYKGFTKMNTSDTLVIDYVQLSDGGEYECRTTYSNGTETSVIFNVTISTDPILGDSRPSCLIDFTYDDLLNCCTTDNGISLTREIHYSRAFFAYNVQNISVQQKWLSPPHHYHNDLGLVISNFHSSQYQIKVTKYPVFVTSQVKISVMSIISVADYQYGTLSVCIPLYIKGRTPVLQVNESLPVNSTVHEGDVAIFNMLYESPAEKCISYIIYVKYYHRNNITYNRGFQACRNENNYHFSKGRYNVNISVTGLAVLLTFQFRFYIVNTSDADNNSIVSFSIASDGQLLWEKNATLLVVKRPPQAQIPHKGGSLAKILTIVLVVSSTLVITLVISSVLIYLCKRQTRLLEPDRVPLTNAYGGSQSSDSECNTPVSEQMQLSVRQVIDYTGSQRAALTTEAWRDNDQGYDSDQERNLCDFNCKETKQSTFHDFKSKKIPQPYIQYTDPSCDKEKREGNCMVYISYTEEKADWVYDYLKPLLESWSCRVILHDEDMIPGFTVSGERQRLILQAHRVILVVSPDYSSSPWCLYELQHAITKEPVLFRGRIIPIMADGCLVLPILVKGIVPLFDSSKSFEVKLRMNICGMSDNLHSVI